MPSVHHLAPTTPETSDCAYNLFRNKQRPEILCAVPEDRPIPRFVVREQWTYAGSLQPQDPGPSGFHDRAASAGVRFNGFYLFQVTAAQVQARIKEQNLVVRADPLPEPEAGVSIRQHVRTMLLRLLARHGSPEQVIEYLSRSTTDHRSAEVR